MMNGYNDGYGMMRGYGVFNYGGALIVFLLILVIGYALYKVLSLNNGNSNDEAYEILKNRFVQGEITEEEFLRRKKILKSK